MTYLEWYKTHGSKHKALIKKLSALSDEALIDYFDFENMCKEEPDFCPLYNEHKKCHDTAKLNCYLCACPYFKFDDTGITTQSGKTIYSTCMINAKEGKTFETEDAIHLDCSACLLPHKEAFIQKHFSRDWFDIMQHSISSDGQ